MLEEEPAGLFFMTPVWGRSYTQLFLDLTIPSYLAPGNLPSLRDPTRCRFVIFTTPADAEVITGAPAYRALADIIAVQIESIKDKIDIPHDAASRCFRRGIRMADDLDAASVFLTPDLIFSDGAFGTLERLAMEGSRVIYITGIRLVKQAAARLLREKCLTSNVLTIPPRDLMRIALNNLHPLAVSSLWEEGEGDLVPANLYWRVGTEGILARCFHLHPLLVFPERKHAPFFGTVDDDYVLATCPDSSRDYIVRDSDELLAVELSDASRYFLTGMRKGSMTDVAFWAEMAANSRHRQLVRVPIRLHTGCVDEEAWRRAELKSNEVVSGIQSLLERSSLPLLIKSPQTLERRLLLRAKEKSLESPSPTAQEARVGLRGWERLFNYLLRIPLSRIRWHSPLSIAYFVLSLYWRVVPLWLTGVKRIRRIIFGSLWTPNILNITWIYMRRLSRDVGDTLAELEKDVVVCGDPELSAVAAISSRRGVERFGLLVGSSGGYNGDSCDQLVDFETGSQLAEESVGSAFIDATLRRGDDLRRILHEVDRVLRKGGSVAIKTDRLPTVWNSSEDEVYLSLPVVCEALRPKFRIIACRRQGGIGTAIAMSLARYAKLQISMVSQRSPIMLTFLFIIIRIPVEILMGVCFNLLGVFLDYVDRTGRTYVSSIAVARKCGNGGRGDS